MAEPAERPWTVEAFFAWQERQSERYELVGGFPLKMMAGAKNRHDDIVVNLVAALRNRLRGTPCRPFTGDGSVEARPGQIRRPDAGIDCGRRDPDGYRAAEPKLVAEVLSPSTRDFDTLEKLAEYKEIEGLDVILVIESNAPQVVVWTRDGARSWSRSLSEGLEAEIALPTLGIALPLAELFESVEFPPAPRLSLA